MEHSAYRLPLRHGSSLSCSFFHVGHFRVTSFVAPDSCADRSFSFRAAKLNVFTTTRTLFRPLTFTCRTNPKGGGVFYTRRSCNSDIILHLILCTSVRLWRHIIIGIVAIVPAGPRILCSCLLTGRECASHVGHNFVHHDILHTSHWAWQRDIRSE